MKLYLTILLLAACIISNAQPNLVPNPGFENITRCPVNNTDYVAMENWFTPLSTSPDFYNACASVSYPAAGVPNNMVGHQTAFQGDGYAGLLLYAYLFQFREYIGVKLTQPLQANLRYCLKFYVAEADSAGLQAASIGAYFGDSLPYVADEDPLPYTPQIQNAANNFINDTSNWKLIEGEFVALGGEQFMYIGNFNTDANTPFDPNGPSPGQSTGQYYEQAYVYIDNVKLEICDTLKAVEEIENSNKIQLYPNPAVGFITVETPANYTELQLEVYSLTGALVYQTNIKGGVKNKVNLTALAGGMYVAQVLYGNTVINRKKVLVNN